MKESKIMWDLPLDVLVRTYALLVLWAGLVWLLTPLGRRWFNTRWRCARHRLVKPERYSNQRAENWLRGHPWTMGVLLWVPLTGAIVALLLPLLMQQELWPGSLCLRFVMAGAVLWLARETVQAHRELRKSPWMRTVRLIDRR